MVCHREPKIAAKGYISFVQLRSVCWEVVVSQRSRLPEGHLVPHDADGDSNMGWPHARGIWSFTGLFWPSSPQVLMPLLLPFTETRESWLYVPSFSPTHQSTPSDALLMVCLPWQHEELSHFIYLFSSLLFYSVILLSSILQIYGQFYLTSCSLFWISQLPQSVLPGRGKVWRVRYCFLLEAITFSCIVALFPWEHHRLQIKREATGSCQKRVWATLRKGNCCHFVLSHFLKLTWLYPISWNNILSFCRWGEICAPPLSVKNKSPQKVREGVTAKRKLFPSAFAPPLLCVQTRTARSCALYGRDDITS